MSPCFEFLFVHVFCSFVFLTKNGVCLGDLTFGRNFHSIDHALHYVWILVRLVSYLYLSLSLWHCAKRPIWFWLLWLFLFFKFICLSWWWGSIYYNVMDADCSFCRIYRGFWQYKLVNPSIRQTCSVFYTVEIFNWRVMLVAFTWKWWAHQQIAIQTTAGSHWINSRVPCNETNRKITNGL